MRNRTNFLAVSGLLTLACMQGVSVAGGPLQGAPPNDPAKKDDPAGTGKRSGGKFAEFERKVRAMKAAQDEANEISDRVKNNPNATEEDMKRLRSMQTKVSAVSSDVFDYMGQERFTDADRQEMQKIIDAVMSEPRTKPKGATKQ